MAWTYDRIGNRLTETRDGLLDGYEYTTNTGGGNTPKLLRINLAFGGTRDFGHGPAGHLTQVSSSGNVVEFTYDAVGRLELADRLGTSTAFTYDGRSYLTQSGAEADPLGATIPVYSSEGLLQTLTQRVTAADPGKTHHVFHFAGRPVAQLSIDGTTESWRYLTTDHLGTPWVATDSAGAELWHGPFEPFGRDRWAGTNLAASAEEVFLRFPGQWDDEAWLEATRGAELYYNVHRWYRPQAGSYNRPDPIGLAGGWNLYGYTWQNPISYRDLLGLATFMCKRPLQALPDAGHRSGPESSINPLFHQYICIQNGQVVECGGQTSDRLFGPGKPSSPDSDFLTPNYCKQVEPDDACVEKCLKEKFTDPRPYYGLAGPGTNCQEWADDMLRTCRNECSPPAPVDLPSFKGFF